MDDGLLSMVSAAGGMEKAILILLVFSSVALWSVVFLKIPELYAAKKNSARFLEKFHESETFANLQELDKPENDCVHLRVFKAALAATAGKRVPAPPATKNQPATFRIQPANTTEELILLNMQHTSAGYLLHMQKGLSMMATLGSTTPFIGLFGTVVGIMTTFHDLGMTKTPSMQVVAPGISGALVATAAGLAVAIPAVIACNSFNAEIEELRELSNVFIEKMMALIRANSQTATPAQAVAAAPRAPAAPVIAAKPAAKAAAPADDDDGEDEDDEEDEDAELAAKPAAKAGQKARNA
ncbi:MAG TPA: MotA/TolQ/ExbB proton channel family protein [Planctomycetota bacterium]|nr:MotA/TolQ/ExbB proton channel family protein [Planctomycetota bacterium]